MSTADIAHVLGFVAFIWAVYLLEMRTGRRVDDAQAMLDKAIVHRRAMREAMVLAEYGARDEAYQVLDEAFEDEPV
jgi:hypothetical protein